MVGWSGKKKRRTFVVGLLVVLAVAVEAEHGRVGGGNELGAGLAGSAQRLTHAPRCAPAPVRVGPFVLGKPQLIPAQNTANLIVHNTIDSLR